MHGNTLQRCPARPHVHHHWGWLAHESLTHFRRRSWRPEETTGSPRKCSKQRIPASHHCKEHALASIRTWRRRTPQGRTRVTALKRTDGIAENVYGHLGHDTMLKWEHRQTTAGPRAFLQVLCSDLRQLLHCRVLHVALGVLVWGVVVDEELKNMNVVE